MNKTTAAGLLIALGGPPVFVAISERLFGELPSLGVQVTLQLLYCAMAAFLLWFVLRVERLPLKSIGLRGPTWLTVASGIGLLLVASFVVAPLTTPLQEALGTDGMQAGLDQIVAMPVWFRIVVGVTGGMIEEFFYRGYAIERLATVTGRAWIGGLISALVFGLAHIPEWGLRFALAADLPFGVLMTAFYLWRRDLLANMLAHCTGLVLAMLALP